MNATLFIILAALAGMYISFTFKFKKRAVKTEWSFKFWWKDNWPEQTGTVVLLTLLLAFLLSSETVVNFDEKLATIPFLDSVPVKPLAAALIGFFVNQFYYGLSKAKKNRGIEIQKVIEGKD